MDIFLIRHGEQKFSYDAQGRKLVASPDAPLTDLGKIQLQELGKKIAGEGTVIDALYISPVLRAQQSAEILADILAVSNRLVIEELQEVSPNSAEGKTFNELEKIGADIYAHPFSESQESLIDLIKRAEAAKQLILRDAKERGYKSVGIVGHGDPLCALDWVIKHTAPPTTYHEMKKDFYPQKGYAYVRSLSSDEPFKVIDEGRVITTEAAIKTIEGFRNPNKEVQ